MTRRQRRCCYRSRRGWTGRPAPRCGSGPLLRRDLRRRQVLGPVSKCSVEPRRGPGGDPARRRFVWIPVLYPDETPTRPVVVWARRRLARHFETGPKVGGMAQTALDRLRAICLALPEVTERPSHGAPTWYVRGKATFVTLWADGHHDDRFPHLWCAAPPGAQHELTAGDPDRFFRPPYVGGRGWLGVRL